MKRKNTILSLLLVLNMVVSTFAVLPMAAFAETTYPGGVLLYESFTGIVATGSTTTATTSSQPAGTSAEIYRKRVGNDSGAGLGDYAMQKDNTTTNFIATIPTAYLGAHTDTSVVTAQGPNAKLTMEFDFKFDGEVPAEASTLTAISIGNSNVAASSTGRGNAAVAIYMSAPNAVRIYRTKSSYDEYYLPTGVTFDRWHRYQLAVDLTDADSAGASIYTFTIDGINLVDENGVEQASFTKKLSVNEITKLRIDTTNSYTTGLDNISVYKTTDTYASLSTGELMTKLQEVNAKMENYRTAAEGTSQLEALESAVAAAGTMVTTAFGTYDTTGAVVTAAKTQGDVDTALENLTEAQEALEAHLSGITYPGGVLLYESFTGIVDTGSDTTATTTSQPSGTNATIFKKRVGNDSGAGLGDYARQSDYSASSVIAEFDDASYFGEYIDDTTTVDEVAAQGPNARLTLEFDHKMESPDDEQTADLRIMLGTKEMTTTMNSTGRAKSAASVFLKYPNIVNVYYSGSSADTYYLPDGMTIEQWHRYQLTLNLTDENSAGMSSFTFTVDGKNLVNADGNSKPSYETILDNGAITKAQLVSYYADVNGVDNVSVYKSNADNEELSTGALMTKLHEVNAKMALYRAAAEGTEAASRLAAFETAVANAGTMVTTAFGTYDAITGEAVTAAKTQDDVNSVLGSLEDAEASLKAVLPYYGISEHNIDENDNITAVTVEEIKAYTGSPVKLIVATFDTNGLSEVSMQDFTGADEYVLSTALSVTDKSAEVYVWEMNDLIPLANTYRFGKAVVQD